MISDIEIAVSCYNHMQQMKTLYELSKEALDGLLKKMSEREYILFGQIVGEIETEEKENEKNNSI